MACDIDRLARIARRSVNGLIASATLAMCAGPPAAARPAAAGAHLADVNPAIVAQVGGSVTALAVAPDGSTIAAAVGGQVRLGAIGPDGTWVDVARLDGVPAPIHRLLFAGDLLYVAHAMGISIIDVSARAAPRLRRTIWWWDEVTDVAVVGDTGIGLAGRYLGFVLLTFDVNAVDPADEDVEKHLTFGSHLVVADRTAYMVGTAGVLRTLDVRDPAEPTPVGELALGSPGNSIVLDGDRAFVGTDRGIAVIAIADPHAPRLLSTYPAAGAVTSVAVHGSTLSFATSQGVGTAAIVDRTTLRPVSFEAITGVRDLATIGDDALLIGGDNALALSTSPTSSGGSIAQRAVRTLFPTFVRAEDLTVVGDYAYVAAGESGLAIVDIADPSRPRIVAGLPFDGGATRIAVDRDAAYVATMDGTLVVADVADPVRPKWAATTRLLPAPDAPSAYPDLGWTGIRDVAMTPHSRLLVTLGRPGMVVLDTSTPLSPTITGAVVREGWFAEGISTVGDVALVGTSECGSGPALTVVDTLARDLRTIGELRFACNDIGRVPMLLADNILWTVSLLPAELFPGRLRWESGRTPPPRSRRGHAALSIRIPPPPDDPEYMVAVDVTDPGKPVFRTESFVANPAGHPRDAVLLDGHLWVASTTGRVYREHRLLDLGPNAPSSPPFEAVELHMPGAPLSIAVVGDRFVVAADDAGLVVVAPKNVVPTATSTPNLTPLPTRTRRPTPPRTATPPPDIVLPRIAYLPAALRP